MILQDICANLLKTCANMGVHVQHEDLDAEELQQFLDERRVHVQERLKELADKKAAKMLRAV